MNKNHGELGIDMLKSRGIKKTKPRIAILDVFLEHTDDSKHQHCEPLDAEQIHKHLKNKRIDLVTVYRTLATFESAGILEKVDLGKESAFYELSGGHHHHIVCTDCGLVEDFENCNLDKISKDIISHSSTFKTITKHSLQMFGLCKTCSKI